MLVVSLFTLGSNFHPSLFDSAGGKPYSPLTTGFWVSSASGRHWGKAGGEMREKLGFLAGISSLTAPAALQWPRLISGGTPRGLAPAGQPQS